ncbi:MAG TPA: HAD family hydrolase [Candidatus Eubacterium faecipullorum]|uniref:HAD family hydrolase n=1 Tax=Candidatus Eubacterium faecipullorum TaxID=2838571 RepID=A0A9D1RG26_9FIRM|nr:HAD family hydrolase [Candidatus Eubacterium faecipullorum]
MIIATDLDGTLLSDSISVSSENLDAVKRLYKNGIKTVIATGRTFFEIPQKLLECEYIDYIIYSNGAAVYKRGAGAIYSNYFNPQTAAGVFRILNHAKTFIELYAKGIPLVDAAKFNERAFSRYRIDTDYLPELRRSRKPVGNLEGVIRHPGLELEMFDVFFRDMQERAECRHRIKACFPELQITTSMRNNLEIMNGGVNKGTGLLQLCRTEGFDPGSVIAVGDSKNDLPLFAAAKFGFAVSNACPELKAVSEGVICSNEEHVLCCLEEIVGKKVLV